MAITSYMPLPESIEDPVSYDEAVALFAETPHPVSKNTLVRLAKAAGFHTERVGRTDYVSYSDLLVAHKEWVAARLEA